MLGLNVGDGQLKGGNPDGLDKLTDDLPVADEGGFRFGVSFSLKPTLHHLLKLGQLGGSGGVADDAKDLLRKLLGLELLGEVLNGGGGFSFSGSLKFQGKVDGLVAEGRLGGELLETWCWVPSGERKHMIHFEELGDFLRDAIYNRLTTSHPCPPNF
jgi:hypothetical protein